MAMATSSYFLAPLPFYLPVSSGTAQYYAYDLSLRSCLPSVYQVLTSSLVQLNDACIHLAYVHDPTNNVHIAIMCIIFIYIIGAVEIIACCLDLFLV